MIGDEPCGLRARKKRQTRRDLHRAALEIATELGTSSATVEAIAARAGVSVRTFFNYYSSKEDALIGFSQESFDELRDHVLAQPEADVYATVRAAVSEHVQNLRQDSELWLLRRKLAATDPGVGLIMLGVMTRLDRTIVEACMEREQCQHPDGDLLPVAAQAGAAMGAVRSAVRIFLGSQDSPNLDGLIDEAYRACGWSTATARS